MFFQPFRESIADFINFGIGELYALRIPYLDVVAIVVFADTLHHVWTGVMQGVFQKAHTVITAVIAPHTELVPYLEVLVAARHGELIQRGKIGDFHLRVKQTAHISSIHARRNPAFTEVEVKIFKGDALRFGFLQRLQCLLHFRHTSVFRIVLHPCLDTFRLLYHVTRDKSVSYLVTGYERVVEDTSVKGLEQFFLRTVGNLPHIVKIDRAVSVERSGQRFFG